MQIDWNWGGYADFLDQIEIQVDRGSGWGFLTMDTTPGYTDSTPHPTVLTRWKYRAIYRVDDHQVGLWSNEVSVTWVGDGREAEGESSAGAAAVETARTREGPGLLLVGFSASKGDSTFSEKP